MDYDFSLAVSEAERTYHKARNQAFWSSLLGRLRGQSNELLNFQEVKQKLRLNDERYLGLQEVPLDDIVGSVGRYMDFTRRFLPKSTVNKDRWKAIELMTLTKGYPPVELYKVGDAYFVLDGNHRVSVARANQMATIEAYVTELKTGVPFATNTTMQDLWLKEGYAYFLRETHLDGLRPNSSVLLTEPGRYTEILEHIAVHSYYLGIECDCPPSWDQAVTSWYDRVYIPMVMAVREHGILEEFPDRTEADMYVWLIRHQAELQDLYGGEPPAPQTTLDHFLAQSH
jgi:hypothetical protein